MGLGGSIASRWIQRLPRKIDQEHRSRRPKPTVGLCDNCRKADGTFQMLDGTNVVAPRVVVAERAKQLADVLRARRGNAVSPRIGR